MSYIPSKSPLATGEVAHHTMGQTKSGKTIHSHPEHAGHQSFDAADHTDAYFSHKKRVNDLLYAPNAPGKESLVRHHTRAMDYHKNQAKKKGTLTH